MHLLSSQWEWLLCLCPCLSAISSLARYREGCHSGIPLRLPVTPTRARTVPHAAAGPGHVDGEALARAHAHLARRARAGVEVAPARGASTGGCMLSWT